MENKEKTKEQLITELEKLQLQIDELRPSMIKPEQNGSLFHIKDSYLRLMHVITAVTADETIGIKDAFESILNEICHFIAWPIGHVYALAKDDPDLLVPTEYWHLENNINKFTEFCNVTAVTKFARGIGLPGRVLFSGKPCFIRDVRNDRGFLRAGIAKDLGIKSGVAFPVYVGTKIVAVQEHFTTEEVSFDNQFMEILVDLGTQIGRIFERKQIRNGVNEVEERYQAVFEQATDSLAIVDGNTGEIVEFNKHAHENLGYTREEFKKLKVSDIDVIESPDDITKHIQKIMREGIDTFETRHKTKDGEIRDMQIIAKVMSIPGKNLISSVWRDITERKQAEGELKRSRDSLTHAQQIAHLGNWEWDVVENESFCSDELYRIHGLKPQQYPLVYEKFLELVHADDREFVMKSVTATLYDRKPYNIEFRVIRPDGSERTVHSEARVIYDKTGKPLSMIGTEHDITERKQMEEKLYNSEKKYRELTENM